MSDLRSKRTIHTQRPIFGCGSVIELPARPGQAHGRFACVMRKVSNEDAWKVALVDVAKARIIEGSEMELSGAYLVNAKLAYSSYLWSGRCIEARLDESRIASKMGSLPRTQMLEEVAHG